MAKGESSAKTAYRKHPSRRNYGRIETSAFVHDVMASGRRSTTLPIRHFYPGAVAASSSAGSDINIVLNAMAVVSGPGSPEGPSRRNRTTAKRKAAPKDRFSTIVSELNQLHRECCLPPLARKQT
jgi:hypothetical protein